MNPQSNDLGIDSLGFKTIYFPSNRVKSGSSKRVTISIPSQTEPELVKFVSGLTSSGLRSYMGDPFLDELEIDAKNESRSVSNICLHRIRTKLQANALGEVGSVKMGLDYPGEEGRLGVTFRDSLSAGVFGWYPYVEGFSANYVSGLFRRFGKPRFIYDPFGGSGTVMAAASLQYIPSAFSEINPFMQFVSETKMEAMRSHSELLKCLFGLWKEIEKINDFRCLAKVNISKDLADFNEAFPSRDYFEDKHLHDLLACRAHLMAITRNEPLAQRVLLLACASQVVASSNMTRRADLRRRKPGEYKDRVVNVGSAVLGVIERFFADLEALPSDCANVSFISQDCRKIPDSYQKSFDLVVTSPPYLNGTNYFRNTKLELWLCGFLKSEEDLPSFHNSAIAGGINSVKRGSQISHQFDVVESIARQLEETDGDRRIPVLIRKYFSDMRDVFAALERSLTDSGKIVIDIGDSKFYGIHVPTDTLLVHVADSVGLQLESSTILARRHSRDKSPLKQVELVFSKKAIHIQTSSESPLSAHSGSSLHENINSFGAEIPFKKGEYIKKNWGSQLHSLCSYQGKMKPAVAHWIIKTFSAKGQSVYDPLCGVGTIPFEACLLGRKGYGNDLSELAFTVASAKVNPPGFDEAMKALEFIHEQASSTLITTADLDSTEFGLNGRVMDYYHDDTLRQVLSYKKVFLSRKQWSNPERFIWANLLHLLHGNRPYALSRTSHPITPFHPKGDFICKDVKIHIESRLNRLYPLDLTPDFEQGHCFNQDFCNVDGGGSFADLVFTSPPFPGMRFDRPNWLRLWFCGWSADSFTKVDSRFLDRRQVKSRDCYSELFDSCYTSLKLNGLLVLHLGGGRHRYVEELKKLGSEKFKFEGEVMENVISHETHGIADRGLTDHHHFVFFSKR